MKKGRIYHKKESENFRNKKIKISNSTGTSTKLVSYSYGNILYLRYDSKDNFSREKLPYDIENKLFNLDTMYELFDLIGSDNVTKFEIVPAFGSFKSVLKNDNYNIDSVFENANYPVKEIHFEIDENKAIFNFYRDNSVVYNVGFNVENYVESIFNS